MSRSRWRWLAAAYPVLTLLVVVVTANHFRLVAVTLALGLKYTPTVAFAMVGTGLVILLVAIYILMCAACIGFFARRGLSGFNWLSHLIIPLLGIAAFVPAWLTAAGIKVFSFVTPLAPPLSYMAPGVGGFMVLGVIYLIYLYRTNPGRITDVGLVHLDAIDGASCGVAVECAMNTVLVVDLIKGVPYPWPRLESDTHIMSAGSARPLEDAFRIAQHDMVGWVAELCGLDPLDAYQLVTQAVESPLANVCDTNYTSIAKMAKRHLDPGAPMDGAHVRLRDLAGEYRH